MKKLVTAFAACALAGLGLAQVESVNIVGYQTIPLAQNGYTATCATFAPIGMTDGNMTLGDIVANENFVAFADAIQVFDASGSVYIQATYVSQATLEDWGVWPDYEAGWYDLADDELALGTLNDTVLAYGTSMTVFTGSANAGLLYAGEVVQSDISLPLAQNGYTAIGNASPVDLTLGDIVANENFVAFADAIQIFDASGSVSIQATYVSQATLEDWGVWPDYEAGWYDLADDELALGTLNNTVIPAGQGMTVFTGNAGAAITIPNPMPAP
jgi:hypothetical protein